MAVDHSSRPTWNGWFPSPQGILKFARKTVQVIEGAAIAFILLRLSTDLSRNLGPQQQSLCLGHNIYQCAIPNAAPFKDLCPNIYTAHKVDLLQASKAQPLELEGVFAAAESGDIAIIDRWIASGEFLESADRIASKAVENHQGEIVCRIFAAFEGNKAVSLDRFYLDRKLAEDGDIASLRFLHENGLIEFTPSTLTHLMQSNHSEETLKYLMPFADRTVLKGLLLFAVEEGDLELIKKYFKYGPSLKEKNIIEEMLVLASRGKESIVRYFCREFPISQESKNKALVEAALRKEFDSFKVLVDEGATIFTSALTANFAFKGGFLVGEEEIARLPREHRYKTLSAYLTNGVSSKELLKNLQSAFSDFSREERFCLLEALLSYNSLSLESQLWVKEKMVELEPKQGFQLARIALIKGLSIYGSMKEGLADEYIQTLKILEGRVAAQRKREQQLKMKLIGTKDERPSLSEWEERTRRQIESQKEKILKVVEQNAIRVPGVTYHKECFQIVVVEFAEMPGLIFKIFPDSSQAEMRHRQTKEALVLCQNEGLDLLHVPYSTILTTQQMGKVSGNSKSFLVEEKVDALTRRVDYQERVKFLSRDPELKLYLKETFRQATVFISRTGYYDPRFNNAPLMRNRLGMALVDIDSQGSHPSLGLYEFQADQTTPLVYSVDEENIGTLKKTPLEIDPDRFKDYDFEANERPRRELLEIQKQQEGGLIKRGCIDNDPIALEEGFFEGLTELEALCAKKIIHSLNEKLKGKEYFQEARCIRLEGTYRMVLEMEDSHPHLISANFSATETLEKAQDFLMRKGVVFHMHSCRGGMCYYC